MVTYPLSVLNACLSALWSTISAITACHRHIVQKCSRQSRLHGISSMTSPPVHIHTHACQTVDLHITYQSDCCCYRSHVNQKFRIQILIECVELDLIRVSLRRLIHVPVFCIGRNVISGAILKGNVILQIENWVRMIRSEIVVVQTSRKIGVKSGYSVACSLFMSVFW